MLAPVLRGKVAGMQFSNAFKQRANFTLFRVEWGEKFLKEKVNIVEFFCDICYNKRRINKGFAKAF